MSPNSDPSGRARSPSGPPPTDDLAALCAAHAPIPTNGHFPPGTTFGDWRLTAFIGRGGNGEVYCAEHASLGTPAAVKVLMREDDRAKARFAREAKLLANLKSDAFPRFFAYGEANGHPYLAMELLEPGELPTGERAIARFLLKVCDAVSELHTLGYIHRDIKPSNILWRTGTTGVPPVVAATSAALPPVGPARRAGRPTGTTGVPPVAVPVLSDLGLVKNVQLPNHLTTQLPNHPTTLGGVGTPGYGAPEQLERGEATVASDIHALGVLADRCFDGNPPRAWARIIQRATSSIPAQRYPSVAAFVRAIHQCHRVWYVMIACAIVAVITAATWICILFGGGNVPQKPGSIQDVREVRDEIQEMKMEQFQRELSKGWSEMTNELRKFYELGVWQREMIDRYKDSWAKGDLEHQAEEKSRVKRDVELLMRDWKAAKGRHAEKIRVWNKQAEELGRAAPTPPEEYSKLQGDVEYMLGNRLAIDCMQL